MSSVEADFFLRAAEARQFGLKLRAWFRRRGRALPWRLSRDPYRIWVSEVMLQQTRAAAVVPYYERFLARYPDLQALARAPEAEVLESWSGLGYYSRARNLRRAAQEIVGAREGKMPRTWQEWTELPGVGPYTAAAVASIAFGDPVAVLDGNVARVAARLTDYRRETGSARSREYLRGVAVALLDRRNPGEFNQALMELGATVCLPRSPRCGLCPVRSHCQAFALGVQEEVPVRPRRRRSVRLCVSVAVVERGGKVLVAQRPPEASRMAGFWELPQAEGREPEPDCFSHLGVRLGPAVGEFRHSITYHEYRVTVRQGILRGRRPDGCRWVARERLNALPLTTISRKALRLAAGPTAPRGAVAGRCQ